MNLEQAIERVSKPPELGVRWDARDCEAGRLLCAEIARLNALLAEAREGLETAAQALHDHVAIEGDQASTAAKVARAILAKLGA